MIFIIQICCVLFFPLLSFASTHNTFTIIQQPILFSQKRINLTKEYIKKHYNINVDEITIKPKMIVLHWTALEDLNKSFQRFYPEKLLSDRKDISRASSLNVSAHFLVDRDGTIYQLMPDNIMARHVIGLNYISIGIENVGKNNLTAAQKNANIALKCYLQKKYPEISYIIGHYEYRKYENTPLWLEIDQNYRTKKHDPGKKFVEDVKMGKCDLNIIIK